jgi:hypothetical protein
MQCLISLSDHFPDAIFLNIPFSEVNYPNANFLN